MIDRSGAFEVLEEDRFDVSVPPRRLPLADVGDVERDRQRDAAERQLDLPPEGGH
jgi:hypothetical protein